MRAAWYERQGPAREVLQVGEMPTPIPAAGEVRIRVAASGINPGDIKKRQDSFGLGMPYPRVIPHSDGAGRVDQVGEGVSSDWVGRAVWCYGAQSYRPFGTAAEFTIVRWIMWLYCPTMCRRTKALALEYQISLPTAPYMSGATSPGHCVGPRSRRSCRNVCGATRSSCGSACNRHCAFVR